jgi:tRNA(Ile)-lysidine synthase
VKGELLLQESTAVQVEIIRRALVEIGSGEREVTQEHYGRLLRLAQGGGGKKVELPGGFLVRSERGSLIFERAGGMQRAAASAEGARINVPGETRFGDYRLEAKVLDFTAAGFEEFKKEKTGETEWFDLEKIARSLYIRGRKPGDRFVPLGQQSAKKAGKFLTACRVTRDVRERVLIVCDEEKIIWLWPVRMSEEVKVTKETKKVLQLRITMDKGA